MSLYEDLVAAWVPAKHEWLKFRALGKELVNALGNQKMFRYCSYQLDSSSGFTPSVCQENDVNGCVDHPFKPRRARVELPVCLDFVGAWSVQASVLNMAISLEGSLPIGTTIETTATHGLLICDGAEKHLYIEDPSSKTSPFDKDDAFRLVKSALILTAIVHDKLLLSAGLVIRIWANIPRGSGLQPSSILAAAVVKGLLQIMDEDDSNENVARLVLVVEQIMGTGGGWQDQIGGLYPGIKCTSSFPGKPLQLQVIPLVASPQLVAELEQHLLVVFTGQVWLENEVLQKVVIRYLRQDNLLISSIKQGQEALMNGDLDELGEIMLEAWRLHQELDPYCSNEFVDRFFSFADRFCCGYKLVGAGGGGFALLLAKDGNSAKELRQLLEEASDFDVKVFSWSVYLE